MSKKKKKVNAKTLYVPKRKGTIEKYRRIQARYKELYNGERRRIDDCIEIIMKENFIELDATVWRILRTEL